MACRCHICIVRRSCLNKRLRQFIDHPVCGDAERFPWPSRDGPSKLSNNIQPVYENVSRSMQRFQPCSQQG
jgi:hypothetical protein